MTDRPEINMTAQVLKSKKSHVRVIFVIAVSGILCSCTGNFTGRQKDVADQIGRSADKSIESLLVDAYSMLGYVPMETGWEPAFSDYVFGDIRGMIANKGAGPDDQPEIIQIQNFSETPANSYIGSKWKACYDAISQCNKAVKAIRKAQSDGIISGDQAALYLAQAKALRGWYHFEAWRIWEKIPYYDESEGKNIITDDLEVRKKIVGDLAEGTVLPDNMGAPGKFNGTVCLILLAKAKMQMFHDYHGALDYLDQAKNGTKSDGKAIGLAPTYGEIFNIGSNGSEDIYSVQYSVNDGTGGYNSNYDGGFNPQNPRNGSPGGCCGVFNPTQEFVNSFRTSGGLPLLDGSYNSHPVKSDQGVMPENKFVPDSGPLDPRIDWTVGRRGIPYLDWGKHKGSAWKQNQAYAGPWSPMKMIYKKSLAEQNSENGTWTSGYKANVYHMIRYADVLLLIAECQIETGNPEGALRNINLVRARAANPAGFVMDGNRPAANYQISLYQSFPDIEYARQALRMERKLELGMEGQRWFDLKRWGIAREELSRILSYEKSMPWGPAMYNSVSAGEENRQVPLPAQQTYINEGSH